MWVTLSLLLLFVGYCWLDSLKSPFLSVSESSSASDDEAEEMTGLTEILDESLQSKREDHKAWHDMGFMTPDHLPPTASQDWESIA
jgi:hypothetical protein